MEARKPFVGDVLISVPVGSRELDPVAIQLVSAI